MSLRLKPIIKKIMSALKKHGFYIVRIKGDHIIINRNPSLKRPIVLVNVKKLSNAVRQNLIKECKEVGIETKELEIILN